MVRLSCLGRVTFVFLMSTVLLGCGDGSSSSGMLITGTLTEDGGAAHAQAVIFRHSTGERIEGVEICALAECSTTNADGQWGFEVSENFTGGDVLFTVKGHGIDASSIVQLPAGASEVEIDFRHVEAGEIEAHHLTVDGQTDHLEDHDE